MKTIDFIERVYEKIEITTKTAISMDQCQSNIRKYVCNRYDVSLNIYLYYKIDPHWKPSKFQ